jgi:hypothetical protein
VQWLRGDLGTFGLNDRALMPGKVVEPPQAIQHGAADALPRIASERNSSLGVVPGGGIDEADAGILEDVLQIEVPRQPPRHIACDGGG